MALKKERVHSAEWRIAKKIVDLKIPYIIMIATFALFMLTRMQVFIFTSALVFVLTLIIESFFSADKIGWKKEFKETIIAALAAAVLWLAASYFLQTSAPLNGILSCSMLPSLERGDMVVLNGWNINAPEVNVTESEWKQITNSGALHFACGVCRNETANSPCLIDPRSNTKVEGDYPLEFECGSCENLNPSTKVKQTVACTKSVTILGKKIEENLSNDVVVYTPLPSDVFSRSGDIIHRVFVKINVEGKNYYLIKGDNNPGFDVQVVTPTGDSNSPVAQERVIGKVMLRLPYIGYYKIFLAGITNPALLETPAGCDAYLVH
ncbi:hypothetical protein HY992_01535 [Candidatus Micrarchaeota archaeon]|nr:hypothetical protein [Candidatus Micrarchaeota archaeon]